MGPTITGGRGWLVATSRSTLQARWIPLRVGDVDLEVLDEGAGDPVVLVQTALLADELLPLVRQLQMLSGYRTVVYHRRGYAGSSPATSPGSVSRDAADCHALLSGLEIGRAHVVGLSYSSAVALQLAFDTPADVHTLTLLEPPPVSVPSSEQFRAATLRLIGLCGVQGPAVALDEFMAMLVGSDWQLVTEGQLPGSVEQMRRDAQTFFGIDLPALLDWSFTVTDAGRVACPVLHVSGTDSGEWFRQVRDLVLTWFPHAEDVVIDGADHSLALTHPVQVAEALVRFLDRHPL